METDNAPTRPKPPPVTISELFYLERHYSAISKFALYLYAPLGVFMLILRSFIGFHAFLIACFLSKATTLRSAVLRVMCTLLGVVVTTKGVRSEKIRMICANHVSVLDHLAVDLVHRCILPSVWDIPALLRWCFGYVDLGIEQGRSEFVRRARKHLDEEESPLLSFPEGAITSGEKALLKFSSWPCEVSTSVQPLSIHITRPIFSVRPSVLGGTWYSDVFWFMFLPWTRIQLNWLPVLTRGHEETPEDFAARIAQSIAEDLGLATSNLTNQDAVDAMKRHVISAKATRLASKRAPLDVRRLDDVAMKIKQSHPSTPLLAIRLDLDKTRDQQLTVERIKTGKIVIEKGSTCSSKNPTEWKKLYQWRKWDMIETNREKYMERLRRDTLASGDH